jgi:hypothetical protein
MRIADLNSGYAFLITNISEFIQHLEQNDPSCFLLGNN